MHISIEHLLLYGVAAVSIALMLLRPRGIPEVYWAGGGALLLVFCRLIAPRAALNAVAQGSDVYLFLAGMMLLSELAREHAVFDWAAARAAAAAHGSASRLFLLIYLTGVLTTALLSNDATAVVLTPAVLAAVGRSRVPPLPFLFACAMVANAASFVLPISNPANLVVFHTAMPPLGSWIARFGFPAILAIAVTYFVLRWLFRRELQSSVSPSRPQQPLSSSGRLLLWSLGIFAAVMLIASALLHDLGLPTFVTAVAITALLSIRERCSPLPIVRHISWSTLLLVAALFVLVAGVEQAGALSAAVALLHRGEHLPLAVSSFAAAFSVGVGNNLVNNLPLGLLAGAAIHVGGAVSRVLTDAILIGIDLGPNLSVTGSLATILWLIALRREGVHVSFADFLRIGMVAMPTALAAAVAGSLLMHAAGV